MTDGYEPPKGTKVIGILTAVFLIVGIGTLPLLFIVPQLIGLPAAFIIVGIVFLLFYLDLKNPNGKLTLVSTCPYNYTVTIRSKAKARSEDANEQDVIMEQDTYAQTSRDRKKKKNTTGIYTYFNCPHCGSLNETGNNRCRICGKKL